jgi:hypothetical protein
VLFAWFQELVTQFRVLFAWFQELVTQFRVLFAWFQELVTQFRVLFAWFQELVTQFRVLFAWFQVYAKMTTTNTKEREDNSLHVIHHVMTPRVCSHCNEEKSSDSFSPRQSQCKSCRAEIERQRRQFMTIAPSERSDSSNPIIYNTYIIDHKFGEKITICTIL